jgi:hypothetical protein
MHIVESINGFYRYADGKFGHNAGIARADCAAFETSWDFKRPALIPLLWRGAAKGGGVPRDTNAFMELPYNPKLKIRARELRKAGNLSEVLLWLK